MTARALLLSVFFIVTSVFLAHAAKAEPTPIRTPLAALPLTIGAWHGRVDPPLSEEVLNVLRVDDHTNRSYFNENVAARLYVGYHSSQRQGASIHSPLNCLPGAGWLPIEVGRQVLQVPADGGSRTIEVNRVIIERAGDRLLVFYWYQSQGRVVASEYWGKVYSVLDAIRWNRTDAALVRVTVPLSGATDLDRATSSAIDFTRALFPLLAQHLPS